MKKLTLLLSLCVLGTMVSAQNNLLSLRAPMDVHFWEGSTTFLVGAGSSFQHGFNDHVAAGMNFDFMFATKENTANLLNIEPRVDYYFKSLFNGFHMGSNIGFNIIMPQVATVSGTTVKVENLSALQLGLLPGYSVGLGEKFIFDASMGIGYNLILNEQDGGTASAFSLRPTLSVGYNF